MKKQTGLFLSVALVTIMITSLPSLILPANALTPSTFDDSHTTALYGNSKVCGDHICAPGEHSQMVDTMWTAQRGSKTQASGAQSGALVIQNMVSSGVPSTGTTSSSAGAMTNQSPQNMMSMSSWTTKTGTLTSVQDPGVGHESHQLAIVLSPSDKIYTGIISWTSSQPMQIVELTGPLGSADSKGQSIWTTDDKTKFALTLVNVNSTTGSFKFTGNALAFHYSQPTTFTVSYAVSYMTSQTSDTVKTGTLTSIQDPGVGHESHQLALILPPSSKPYHGILSYSASEPVQLVSLIGPIDPTDKKGQLVYTMDGKTWYALVFVEPGTSMGTWQFAGNALAVHTKNTTPFQVSYTVDAHN